MFSCRALIVSLATVALLSPLAFADEIALSDSEPNVHPVVTGDTLWDIAETYLENPFMWPKIWGFNEQVNNPDLIYPGGKIRIPVALLKPEIREQMVVAVVEPEAAAPVPEVLEVPVVAGVINPLLIESSGYITKRVGSVGKVVGTYGEHFLMGEGDEVFLKMQRRLDIDPGDRFQVVRPVGKVWHPVSHKRMGKMVRVLGVVTVFGKEGRLHQATLDRSFDVINAGDMLIPYNQPMANVSEQRPDLAGVIVAAREGRSILATDDVVYLDRGQRDGLEPGVALQVVRKGNRIDPDGVWGSFRLPDRSIATLRVLAVQDATATAHVENALEQIEVGDRFEGLDTEVNPLDEAA